MTSNLFQSNRNHKKRHQLLAPLETERAIGGGGITTIESLREHLQTAIEIEHSTIPAYLCALYSLREGTNTFASQVIQSVVIEEMLHMVMAANLLNAVGGKPVINQAAFIPEYPTPLPHSSNAFEVPLARFSPSTIDIFLKIEKPAARHAPPEADNYDTIGQFYHAVRNALVRLNRTTPGGIFTGDPALQIGPDHYYGSGGELVAVYSPDDALLAINEIVGQGEGIDGTIEDPDHVLFGEDVEYAHYFKFNEIRQERRYRPTDSAQGPPTGKKVAVDWDAVYPMQDNPKMRNYPKGSELWEMTRTFNQTYMALLDNIHQACNGSPERLMQGIPLMYDLKYKALALMKVPLGNGLTAGPSFEYVEG